MIGPQGRQAYDCIVIGGSFAGLSAAMPLVRARRRVAVFDIGQPRNRFASSSHGFIGYDGVSPGHLIQKAKKELLGYPTAQIINDAVYSVNGSKDDFIVATKTGRRLAALRIILALGVADILPAIPGLQECWGKSAVHCPYCHGFELADLPTAVLYVNEASLSQVITVREWSSHIKLLLNGNAMGEDKRRYLASKGIGVVDGRVIALTHEHGFLTSVVLDKYSINCQALYLFSGTLLKSEIYQQLGCVLTKGNFGPILSINDSMETSVPGVFAAGDIARPNAQIAYAAADGLKAGIHCHHSLINQI